MPSQSKPKQNTETSLTSAIKAVQGRVPGISTLQQLAEQAGVSATTASKVLSGKYGPMAKGTAGLSGVTAKQAQGWAESLTRLIIFVNELDGGEQRKELVVSGVLREYGLYDLKDSNGRSLTPLVDEACLRVSSRHAAHRGLTDPTLDAIAGRRDNNVNTVRAGYLKWEPFIDQGQEYEESWAVTFTRRLVKAINPEGWSLQSPVGFESLDQALAATIPGANSCDIVFGLYDTAYRRLRGTTFLHLPGLGIKIGAIVQKNGPRSWLDIANEMRNHKADIKAVVMQNEVGHLFLRGSCGYKRVDLEIVDSIETNDLAASYFRLANAVGSQAILVADRFTCRRILTYINKTEPKHILKDMEEDNISAIKKDLMILGDAEGDRQSNINAKNGDAAFDMVPTYRIGWGIRSDSPRWLELLDLSMREELFYNGMQWTASQYAELLDKDINRDIELIPFEPDLSAYTARKFLKCLKDLYGDDEFCERIANTAWAEALKN